MGVLQVHGGHPPPWAWSALTTLLNQERGLPLSTVCFPCFPCVCEWEARSQPCLPPPVRGFTGLCSLLLGVAFAIVRWCLVCVCSVGWHYSRLPLCIVGPGVAGLAHDVAAFFGQSFCVWL